MLDRRACLALPALALLAAPACAAETPVQLNGDLEVLRLKHGLPAMAAAVIRNGVIVAAGATGVRAAGSDVKVTLADRFHLGSDTKAFTATLAGVAVEEGRLQWRSTIGDILGAKTAGVSPRLAAVTLEQLLSHSGGVSSDNAMIYPLYFSADALQYTLPEQRLRIFAKWKRHAPQTPPGAEFHYANLGYLIAGAMIETAFGQAWEELVTEKIFLPLGLSSAGIGPQATTGRLDAPVGHRVEKGVVTPMRWGPAADVPPALGPAGAAHMSVLDFATWAGWNAGRGKRGPAIVKPETLAAIHRPRISTGKLPNARPGTPQEGRYALGWGLLKFDWTVDPVLEHNGSNSMNLAKILVDAGQDLGVVVMTNFPGDSADDACGAALETLYRLYASPARP